MVTYETRPNSEQYLANLQTDEEPENIDYHFFKQAYNTVERWFKEPRIDGESYSIGI